MDIVGMSGIFFEKSAFSQN